MQRVRVLVSRETGYSADVSFEWYGDLGTGAIDFAHPLPPGRVRLWPEGAPRAGHLHDAHLVARHLDSVDADGHLEGPHFGDAHLAPALAVMVESPRYVFGRFQHALRMFDGAGNAAATDVMVTRTINAAPAAPRGLRRVGWDAASGSVAFAFEGVRFVAARGS